MFASQKRNMKINFEFGMENWFEILNQEQPGINALAGAAGMSQGSAGEPASPPFC